MYKTIISSFIGAILWSICGVVIFNNMFLQNTSDEDIKFLSQSYRWYFFEESSWRNCDKECQDFDVNEDGQVDVYDTQEILHFIYWQETKCEDIADCDFNCDGKVNFYDYHILEIEYWKSNSWSLECSNSQTTQQDNNLTRYTCEGFRFIKHYSQPWSPNDPKCNQYIKYWEKCSSKTHPNMSCGLQELDFPSIGTYWWGNNNPTCNWVEYNSDTHECCETTWKVIEKWAYCGKIECHWIVYNPDTHYCCDVTKKPHALWTSCLRECHGIAYNYETHYCCGATKKPVKKTESCP